MRAEQHTITCSCGDVVDQHAGELLELAWARHLVDVHGEVTRAGEIAAAVAAAVQLYREGAATAPRHRCEPSWMDCARPECVAAREETAARQREAQERWDRSHAPDGRRDVPAQIELPEDRKAAIIEAVRNEVASG